MRERFPRDRSRTLFHPASAGGAANFNLAEHDWKAACHNRRMSRQSDDRLTDDSVSTRREGLGPDSAGQSGDNQGLSNLASGDSESVAELVEEGQYFEAEAVGGVEDAPDPDVAEVHTKQVPEDDVPSEYLNPD